MFRFSERIFVHFWMKEKDTSPFSGIVLRIVPFYSHFISTSWIFWLQKSDFLSDFWSHFLFSQSLLDLLHWYAVIATLWRHIFLQFITLCRFCCIQTWMFCRNDQSVSTSPLPRSIVKDVPGLFCVLQKTTALRWSYRLSPRPLRPSLIDWMRGPFFV